MKRQPDIRLVCREDGSKHIDFYQIMQPGEDAQKIASILLDGKKMMIWAELNDGGNKRINNYMEWEIPAQSQNDLMQLKEFIKKSSHKPLRYGKTEILDIYGFNPAQKGFLIADIQNSYQVMREAQVYEHTMA